MKKIGESKVSEAGLLYVPKAALFAMNIELGDLVEWFVERDKIVLKKKEASTGA